MLSHGNAVSISIYLSCISIDARLKFSFPFPLCLRHQFFFFSLIHYSALLQKLFPIPLSNSFEHKIADLQQSTRHTAHSGQYGQGDREKFVAADYKVQARSSNKNWKRKCASALFDYRFHVLQEKVKKTNGERNIWKYPNGIRTRRRPLKINRKEEKQNSPWTDGARGLAGFNGISWSDYDGFSFNKIMYKISYFCLLFFIAKFNWSLRK